jgi:transcriptional regulator with XRE-family HTH domain
MSSSSKSKSDAASRSPAGTPGGVRLRALREQVGRAQVWVEAEANLGTGYLQRVEAGRVAQPGRATVERVLEALGARYSERREVLELFGYIVATPLPTDDEIAWARASCGAELHDVPFPAYLLDCLPRLLAWNQFVPRLLGGVGQDADAGRAGSGIGVAGVTPSRWPVRQASVPRGTGDAVLQALVGRSLVELWFDPASPLSALVAEPEAFLPALIRAMRWEMQRFSTEPWLLAMLAEMQATLPRFRDYWQRAAQEPVPIIAARVLAPVVLAVPGVGRLRFRLVSEPLVRDARFRLIYYVPADPVTMRQCAAWATDTPAP